MEAEQGPELREYFQCLLCNKPATCPKLLECLHTFCAGCLERVSNRNDVTCPICEMVTKKGLSSLPDNIFVSNLQKSVQKQQQMLDSAELYCSSCEENTSAEFVCLECDKVLCNKCLHTHQVLMPDHKKHVETLGTLRKLNSDEFLKILRRSKDLICNTHENQPISLYCRNCSMWVCVLCVLLDHNDVKAHQCIPVRRQMTLLKTELQETLAAILTKREEFVESQSQLEQLVDDLNRDKYKLEDLIEARVKAALQKVKEEEHRLLNELQELHSSKTQKLQVSLNSIANVLKRMAVSKNVVSQLLRYATEHEILNLQGMIKSALAELREEKLMDVHVDRTIIDFQECCVFPEKMLGNLMITRLQHGSTLVGRSQLPGSKIAVQCNKEVGESWKCNINKRKCDTAEEAETSKKLRVKEELSSCNEDDSNAGPSSYQLRPTPSIECVTDSNRQEQETVIMDTIVQLIQIDCDDSK
ncbi:protein PML-like [Rhinoraja longicauda]